MSLNVLWRSGMAAKVAAEYKHLLSPDISLVVETDKDKATEHYAWMDVLVDGGPTEEAVNAKNLKHIVVPYVGISESLRQFVLARPHLKLYNSHFNDAFVAQHAVALMLAVSNRITEANSSMHEGNWKPHGEGGFESMYLEDKTCLLLGYGAIGKEIERRVKGLGMNVTAYKRSPAANSTIKIFGPDQLTEALSSADVIMISLPSTPETNNLLNQESFKHIKKGSVLINVGRGGVIDQHALFEALKSKHLLGAGIDVWWNYPKAGESQNDTFPSDAALHELPNLIMSPHRAASVSSTAVASFKDTAKTLNAIHEGKSRNQVDPNKGY